MPPDIQPSFRLVSLRQNPHVLPLPGTKEDPGVQPGAMEVKSDSRPLDWEPGIMMEGKVESDGLSGQAVTASIRFRRLSGDPVLAKKDGSGKYRDPEGRFVVPFPGEAPSKAEGLPSINLWIPFNAIDLPPGWEHTLILTFSAECGGLTAFLEEEFVLHLKEGKPREQPSPVQSQVRDEGRTGEDRMTPGR